MMAGASPDLICLIALPTEPSWIHRNHPQARPHTGPHPHRDRALVQPSFQAGSKTFPPIICVLPTRRMAVSDSAQTVYARFGTKSAIVRALLSQLEDGADAAARRARIAGEPGPRRKLAAVAAWTCAMLSTSRVVIVATEHAASDPAILELSAQATAAAGALQAGISQSKASTAPGCSPGSSCNSRRQRVAAGPSRVHGLAGWRACCKSSCLPATAVKGGLPMTAIPEGVS